MLIKICIAGNTSIDNTTSASYVSECPMSQGENSPSQCPMNKAEDIDPQNMVLFLNIPINSAVTACQLGKLNRTYTEKALNH